MSILLDSVMPQSMHVHIVAGRIKVGTMGETAPEDLYSIRLKM